MLNNISLQTRLIVTMVVLALLISAVGIAGVMGMRASNNALHEVQAIQIPASDAITSSNNFFFRAPA